MKWAWLWFILSMSVELIKKAVDVGLDAVFENAIECAKSSETKADDKSILALLESVYDWCGEKIAYLKEEMTKANKKRGPS